jgi:hypothetical protein
MKKNVSLIFDSIKSFLFTIKKNAHLPFLFFMVFTLSCKHAPERRDLDEPTNGEQEGGYEKYFEATRKAALGDDWARITQENTEAATQARLFPKEDVLAGGVLQGNWYERGGSTVSGSMIATYFYPATEEIYTISSSGTLHKGGLTGGAWTNLGDAINFNNAILAVVPIAGGKRIITAKSDKKIYYSDDDASSWTLASGINPYDTWGSGKKLIVLNNGVMYYLMHTWISSPWGSGYILYRSADNGATWTTTQTFTLHNEDRVAMWSPFGSNDLYVLDNGATLYNLTGTATTLTTLTTGMTLPTNSKYSFSGYKNGSNVTLYTLVNSDVFYKTTDNGATWTNPITLTTALPTTLPKAWSVGIAANPWVADALYYGEVDFRYSTNGGTSWTKQNHWGDYYGNNDLLHADMVSITPFQKTDGTKFLLIGNHGGIHYYPAPYTTTTNLTKTGIRTAEYYDVTTIGSTIFAGSQDQGNQRFAGGAGTSVLTAAQLISGDYVRTNSSLNGTKYWQQYPGGDVDYYDNPLVQQYGNASAQVYGTNRTNIQQWVVPTCNWSTNTDNSILIGGGSVTSGNTTESHVVKMTYNGTGTLAKTEYAYDFMANGAGYISAIDHSPADANYMYVGLNNGKFFYSTNGGTTFTQTVGFTGATNGWNYGSFIHASRTNKNLAFYCGNGGSIYKTINGGVSFTNMSVGLPNTFVSELVLNTAETLLFAATDAGPYVCVLNTGQWYSLATAITPVKSFTAVEYITSSNIARFATFGRGVWDFQITVQPLPVELSEFKGKVEKNQSVSLSWVTQSEKNVSHFDIERSVDGQNFDVVKTVASKTKGGNSISRLDYAATDMFPPKGTVYYRLKAHDFDGKINDSKVIALQISDNSDAKRWALSPSIVAKNTPLSIFAPDATETLNLSIFDLSGKLVRQMQVVNGQQMTLDDIGKTGVFVYRLANKTRTETGKVLVF